MAKLSIKAGTTSKSVPVFIQDSSSIIGAGLTGLVFNTSSLVAYWYQPGVTAPAAITLATLAAITSAWSSGGFKEADATNMPGHYRFDIPNAVLTGATTTVIHFKGATNMAPCALEIELTATDNQDAVHGGMSALPNTACTTNASLLTSGTGTDQLSVSTGRVDVGKALGQAVTLDANNVLNVSAKYWAGTAITATSIPVGTAAGAAGGLFIAGTNAATTVTFTGNLTGSVGSVTGAVGSVTGAVGSVTGNVGGNVTGSVGSVTGNVGGNVTGSVGSIATGGITTASFASGAINAAAIATDAIGAAELAADAATKIAKATLDEVNTGATHNINNSFGKQVRLINPNSDVIYSSILPSQSGVTTSQVKLDTGASSANGAYVGTVFSCVSGTGQGSKVCIGYTGSTRLAVLDSAWSVAPVATDVVEITPSSKAQVIGYATGQDPAALVWVYTTRTLTGLAV